MKTYRVHEIFRSLQGEGLNTGRTVIFVRFAGCNLSCDFCDTPHVEGVPMTLNNIVDRVQELGAGTCWNIIYTGGEPLLQLDDDLAEKFWLLSYWQGLETNGTLPITWKMLQYHLDYVTMSPKGEVHSENMRRTIDELRYPIKAGDPVPDVEYNAKVRYLSPIFDGDAVNQANVDWVIKLCKENPAFRLTMQYHKLWRVK